MRWTDEETEELLDLYGTVSLHYLSKKFNRSEAAIKQKYKSLTGSVDMHMASGLLSVTDIADAIDVDRRTVIDWIQNFNLPATQKHKKYGIEKSHRFFISSRSFWEWANKNRERIPFQRLTQGVILPEPTWLDEQINLSRKRDAAKKNKSWTSSEDETAWFWWQSGMNYREIAKRLDRTEHGTQRRLTILRKLKSGHHTKTKDVV